MATTMNFREVLDLPEWRPLSQPVAGTTQAATHAAGVWLAEDLRNNDYAHPLVYFNNANSTLRAYNIKNDAWHDLISPITIGGSFGTGSTATFVPSMGPAGTLAAGGSTTKVILSTALAGSVATNQLANRGDGKGFIIRIIGNSAGGSGKTEERRIISNTSGTTPTIIVDSAFTFTPASGDRYEILSGSVLFLNTGVLAANQFRRFDIATEVWTALSTTGAPATINASANALIPLDEAHVPSNRKCGEGHLVGAATYDGTKFGCLTATASAAGTITGQASSGDAAVLANQYRNYQIRIVEDTGIPTAVGQRRRITSHTAGTSPVYTLASSWSVTPSATAKFVIENDTDKIIFIAGGITVSTYNYNITANTWDTTTWAGGKGSAQTTGGYCVHSFGVVPDELNNMKSSNIYCLRGGSTSNTIDVLDIAGASTGSWTNGLTMLGYSGVTQDAFTTSGYELVTFAYNPHTQNGKYLYFQMMNTQPTNYQKAWSRLDLTSLRLEKIAGLKVVTSNTTPVIAKESFISLYQDGNTKIAFYNCPRPWVAGTDYWQLMITR